MTENDNITEKSKISLVFVWAIILGVCAVCAFLYSIKSDVASVRSDMIVQTGLLTAHSDANVAQLKQTMTEQYETQASHKQDMDAVTSWNRVITQNQRDLSDKFDKNNVDIRMAIQHLGDMLPNKNTRIYDEHASHP